MEAAFAWIGELARFFASLFPHLVVVRWDEVAVRWRRGGVPDELDAGTYWYWPLLTEVQKVSRMRQVLVVSCLLTTADDVPITIDLSVVYRIDDAPVFLVENEDAEDSIDDLTQGAVRDVVCQRGYADVRQGMGKLGQSLRTSVRKALEDFGCAVEEVRIKSFARTRPVYLVHDGLPEPPSDG